MKSKDFLIFGIFSGMMFVSGVFLGVGLFLKTILADVNYREALVRVSNYGTWGGGTTLLLSLILITIYTRISTKNWKSAAAVFGYSILGIVLCYFTLGIISSIFYPFPW